MFSLSCEIKANVTLAFLEGEIKRVSPFPRRDFHQEAFLSKWVFLFLFFFFFTAASVGDAFLGSTLCLLHTSATFTELKSNKRPSLPLPRE